MKEEIYLASISDIHLGAKKNPARDIIDNLRKAFPCNERTGELDIIFIGGDVFDTLLTFPNDDVADIKEWIGSLLFTCSKYNIALRVLEGTPSHDWQQSKHFITIAKLLKQPIDIAYVRELSIEYIEHLGINVLYVPDECNPTAEKTLSQVRELMRAKGLHQVDIAIMHGAFSYQLPENVKCQKHDPDAYLSLVKYLIFVGHIHTYSTYSRVIAQGSFDRCGHGEEEPKGHIEAKINLDTGNYKIRFIENKGARIYKTIYCKNMSLEDTLSRVDKGVVGIVDGSCIRVVCDSDNPIAKDLASLIRKYPLLTWSVKVQDDETDDELTIKEEESEVVFNPVTITSSNIEKLLLERLAIMDIDSKIQNTATTILAEVK